MPETPAKTAQRAAETFRDKLIWLRKGRHQQRGERPLSQEALSEAMKRAGRPLSQKSISNVEKLAHNSTLASFAEVADAMGIPLWVMFIEGLDFSLLEPPALQRLTQLVDDYRRCTDQQREYIEKMAAGYAGLNPEKKP